LLVGDDERGDQKRQTDRQRDADEHHDGQVALQELFHEHRSDAAATPVYLFP
jgi:hypothetical protein